MAVSYLVNVTRERMRDGSVSKYENCYLAFAAEIGKPLLILDGERYLRVQTSPVERVLQIGDLVMVQTLNSKFRIRILKEIPAPLPSGEEQGALPPSDEF